IIGASTATESPLNLSIAHGEERGSAVALAREYFGPTLPCRVHEDVASVLQDMQADAHCIGVLSADYPHHNDKLWWWQMPESTARQTYVFARLPFVLFRREADDEPVFLAGNITPAPSGDDASLYAVNMDLRDWTAEGVTVIHHCNHVNETLTLFEFNGWVLPNSEAHAGLLDALQKHGALKKYGAPHNPTLHYLGSYAKPLTVNS
ncbi:MAG: hypothetical protein K2Q12_00975, partial [Rickettsiales bacterium]|nr:hypothetical protein [Rickettsiales bacterium]